MQKLKSNRGAAKRFRATGSGKVRRNKAYASHLLTHKSTKQKRNLRRGVLDRKRDEKNIKRILPYL